MMDEAAASGVVDWTRILLAYGPIAGTCIIGLYLCVVTMGRHTRAAAAAQVESARLQGKALLSVSDGLDAQSKALGRVAVQMGTLRTVIQAGPAEYALRKLQIMDGGIPADELVMMQEQVTASKVSITDPAIWDTQDGEVEQCAELERKIKRLRDQIEFSSDQDSDERDRLWKQLQSLLQLREV